MWVSIVRDECQRVWRLKFKGWTSGFRECLARSLPVRSLPAKEPRVEHMIGRWRVMPAWRFSWVSLGKGHPAKYSRNFFFGKKLYFALPSLYPHYIYSHYPQIVRNAFQRENPRIYTWKLEIVIPTIFYTFPCGFPQLLPLNFYILERLITQTLTTPILSVKWDFGAVGKHWKKPRMADATWSLLRDSES